MNNLTISKIRLNLPTDSFRTRRRNAPSSNPNYNQCYGIRTFPPAHLRNPMKLLADRQALELSIKHNRSNRTYSVQLTRLLDRKAHFPINVNLIVNKPSALTNYLSKNLGARSQAVDAYDGEYNKPKLSKLREYFAIYCFNNMLKLHKI